MNCTEYTRNEKGSYVSWIAYPIGENIALDSIHIDNYIINGS